MRTVTVVGASLAGLSTARALRRHGFEGRIVMVGAERHVPYDRPPLSKEFLAGEATFDDLHLLVSDDEELGFEWRLGTHAVRLDPHQAAVELDTGEWLTSDGVVIATGARARPLPVPVPAGVHTLRTVDDALALRDALVPGVRVVLIGAGFIGAEIASTALRLGADVTVVEAMPTPLAAPLGDEMGAVCAALHVQAGVRLLTGTGVSSVIGTERVRGVRLADGRELPADMVIAGIGAVPNTEWLAGSGVTVDGGVVTDARCATNLPTVVAVGDCARSYRDYSRDARRLEHWTNAAQQPTVAAATLLGQTFSPPPLHAVPYFWSDQYGCRLQFAGHRRDGDEVEVVDGDLDSRSFLAVYRRAGELVAAFALNRPKPFGRIRRELVTRTSVSA